MNVLAPALLSPLPLDERSMLYFDAPNPPVVDQKMVERFIESIEYFHAINSPTVMCDIKLNNGFVVSEQNSADSLALFDFDEAKRDAYHNAINACLAFFEFHLACLRTQTTPF
jgi:hypothetical protein